MNDIRMEDFPPNDLDKNALDFSLPASDALLNNRNNTWIQLTGHQGMFAPASLRTIWKKCIGKDRSEAEAYKGLMVDPCRDIVPTFYQGVEYNGDFFIEIENLLPHFQQPSMMDVKVGYRTFQEAEVKNDALRKDLYERMVKLDPLSVTESERKEKAVTKLRYMQFREKESSTAELGFRLEAIMVSGQELMKTCLRKVKEKDKVLSCIKTFVNCNKEVHRKILSRLRYIREMIASSAFFQNHEVIGSSLLFLHDNTGDAGVWMIDFAKTILVENQFLDHTSKWEMGNHEDGYLAGLDNLSVNTLATDDL